MPLSVLSSTLELFSLRIFFSKSSLLVSCILILVIQFIAPIHGSHYGKYHISDYCDPLATVPSILLSAHGNMSAISIRLKREAYKPGMSCKLRIRAPDSVGVMAFIPKIKLRRYNANRADKLELLDANNKRLLRILGFNQEIEPLKTILTEPPNNELIIHFVSDTFPQTLAGKGFKVIVTIYSKVRNNQCNVYKGIDFNCGNNLCLSPMLECDGFNNCGNNQDEMECDETSETKLSMYVFVSTLVAMALFVTIFLMKNKDKRKEIVRRMSRVYGNNPILYVMDSNEFESGESASSTPDNFRFESSFNRPSFHVNSVHHLHESQSSSQHHSQRSSVTTLPITRSKLSLSLPHGINQITSSQHTHQDEDIIHFK